MSASNFSAKHRLSSRIAGIVGLAAIGLFASAYMAGCEDKSTPNRSGTTGRGSETLPNMDVRGGDADSDIYLGVRTPQEGDGGDGGTITILSNGGAITMSSAALTTVPPVPTFAGANGLDVPPGVDLGVSGLLSFDWINVQAGGTLHVLRGTILTIAGDVVIDGSVDGRGDDHALDGRDLTITAGGILSVTGTINCSGGEHEKEDVAPTTIIDFAGGNGGDLVLTAQSAFITGALKAEGGDTFSEAPDTARPGRGGTITLTSSSTLAFSGRMSARGGFCYFPGTGIEADGGTITVTAQGAIEMGELREFNASGGESSGPAAGDGGIISITSPGAITATDFDIEAAGGRTTFSFDGIAGMGGTVTIDGGAVTTGQMDIDVSGGNSAEEDSGEGGKGGTLILNSQSLTVPADVFLRAEGGRTLAGGVEGPEGGNVQIRVNGGGTSFAGTISVHGGKNAFGSFGPDGTICATGVDPASRLSIQGSTGIVVLDCPP